MVRGQAKKGQQLNNEGRRNGFRGVRFSTRLLPINNKEGVGTTMTDKDLSPVQIQILDTYYTDNARKLHRVVDRILSKFGGLTYKDTGDFYSLANEVFVDAIRRYDETQSFDGFLYSCLSNKIMSEITRRNREKRKADRMCISLDAPVGDKDGLTIGDILTDDFDIEKEIFGEISAVTSKLEKYLAMLSRKQRALLELLSYCYRAAEIQKILHMTQKEYADTLEGIHSYEKIRILL